jgi:MoaA/NifB/PqqE/SkfB family radical SAM enzyme
MFSKLSRGSLAKAVLTKDQPIYVQFYITARCNLTCQQCNIIYANSDMRECTISEIEKIADNLAEMGVAIVLLTGGEPFIRKDLPEIIYAFESRGVHVRMQTNGLAKEEQIQKVIEAGGHDISISLDSLQPTTQDKVNGDFEGSWEEAIKTIGTFTRYLPKEGSFGSLGCVLQRDNLNDIEQVIKFGTKIGWYTSLVPVHVTHFARPRGFQTFDQSQRFLPSEYERVDAVLDRVHEMRNDGYLLYDSDQYLNDIKSFIRNGTMSWRERNDGICDSPNLYFAILPNGQFAPCCDHRLPSDVYTYNDDFPKTFRDKRFRAEVKTVTSVCDGCMYGSYPEMTIAMRYFKATIQRMGNFLVAPPKKPWPLADQEIFSFAQEIYDEHNTRPIIWQKT